MGTCPMSANGAYVVELHRMKTLLIIPAYNEEASIERVVNGVTAAGWDYVIVNDGSSDHTVDVCRQHGFRFIDLPVNLGLAGAFQAGVKYARMRGYDCIVQFDGDGQHKVEYVGSLVAALEGCDIAIGSRFVEEKKPGGLRMFGSNLIAAMIRLTTGVRLADPTSGMRAYGPRAIEELAVGPNLGPEPDTLAYLMRKKGLTVREVQVTMDERLAGESYLNLRSSAAYMARMAVSVLVMQFFR